MRDAIAWSHNLLPAEEQTLFRRMAVFTGGFTLEAAAALGHGVDAASLDDPPDILAPVAVLAEQSPLRPVEQTGGEPRFTMLETMREYGLERLAASGEEAAVRQVHAARLLGAAETLLTAMGAATTPTDRAIHDRTLAAAHTAVGDDRFAAARADGAALTLEQAFSEALAVAAHPSGTHG